MDIRMIIDLEEVATALLKSSLMALFCIVAFIPVFADIFLLYDIFLGR